MLRRPPRSTLFPYTTSSDLLTVDSSAARARSRFASPSRTSFSSASSSARRCSGVPSLKRSEEHTSELQSHSDLVCRLLLEKKKKTKHSTKLQQSPTIIHGHT